MLHAKSLNTDKAWEVYDLLVETYFRAKENLQPKKLSAMDQIKLQNEALIEVNDRVDSLEVKIDSLEVNPSQRKSLQRERHKKIYQLLGGKKSGAYKNSSFRGKVYQDLGRAYNNYFDIPGYDCTPRCKFEEGLEVIKSYNLSTELNMELKKINGQVSFEEVV